MIWTVASVDKQPEILLESWMIAEVESPLWEGKTCHFVGYNLTDREGRVSSAIEVFDPDKKLGITNSGRVYQLSGRPGDGSADGQHVFKSWCRLNKVTSTKVATNLP